MPDYRQASVSGLFGEGVWTAYDILMPKSIGHKGRPMPGKKAYKKIYNYSVKDITEFMFIPFGCNIYNGDATYGLPNIIIFTNKNQGETVSNLENDIAVIKIE
ncbi:MAG: hypothetical protein PHR45_08070 [Muribaculaceae bacterium]|nr:hypothetical protein [Muribaculaceae bacterium]